MIIPRGFGGIRTTLQFASRGFLEIIPRGFGGIRTTDPSAGRVGSRIIPRGFGGIRTTFSVECCHHNTDYTERIWRYQDNPKGAHVAGAGDYTERIWRYQDNPI